MLAEIIPLILAILEAAPGVYADIEAMWKILTADTAPTTEEQAKIRAALDAAYKEAMEG